MPTTLHALLVGSLLAAPWLAGCGPGPSTAPPSSSAVRVVATTTVLADLVRQAGGNRVQVESIVPRDGDPHTFEPTPSDIRRVAAADLLVMNGLGLDDWLTPLLTQSGNTRARLVRLGEDLPGVTYLAGPDNAPAAVSPGAGSAASPAGDAPNPHLWLNVAYAGKYVERIVDVLSQVDPAGAAAYDASGRAYLERLAALDTYAREQVATIPEADRKLVSYHQALPYFAAAYGLRVVGVAVVAPGQDPSAGQIADLIDAIRASGVKAIFSEVQFNPGLVKRIGAETGVRVVTDLYSDALGGPPVDTYEGMMRWNVDRIVGALK